MLGVEVVVRSKMRIRTRRGAMLAVLAVTRPRQGPGRGRGLPLPAVVVVAASAAW